VFQLAELTSNIMTNNSKTAKFKAAMKWLLQQLNEGETYKNTFHGASIKYTF
jgi:hypothetical protein